MKSGRAFALLSLAVLTACSTIGDTVDKLNPFASSTPKVKLAELPPLQPTATLKTRWQANVGSSGEFTLTPAVAGESVYAAAKNGALSRYDNGRETWRINVGQPIAGGVGTDGNLVAVGTSKGEVLTFKAADGKPLWQARASSEILAAPAVGDGLVVVRSGDSRLFAFDQNDGKRKWVYQRSVPALSVRSNVGVLLVPGKGILAGFPGGKLVAVSLANGAALWEVTVALPKGATELERVADITSSPVLDGRQACAVAFQGRVSCIDLNAGSMLWGRDISSSTGLDIDAKAVYVSDDKGNVQAFERFTGGSMWKQAALVNRGLSRPLAIAPYVVVGDSLGVVHVMRRDDGVFAARMNTDGSPISAEIQPYGRGFLVQTRNGGLYAVDLE